MATLGKTLEDEFSQLDELVLKGQLGIVAVDGHLGAGKTYFGQQLARRHGFRCIHLDDFLENGQECFVQALRMAELRSALARQPGPVVIEGICLLQVLDKLGLTPDLHIFIERPERSPRLKADSRIHMEVQDYLDNTDALARADMRLITMPGTQTNQQDVDIAYLKARTIVCALLALGGIAAILVGAFVLNAGIQSQDSTVINVLGIEVSAKGIGGVILSSSVLWAYFSYLTRPTYSRKTEKRSNMAADGTENHYEFESATMRAASSPEPRDKDG